jgi:hypothetical protein
VFYAGAFYLACGLAAGWAGWARATAMDPLWPVAWSRLAGIPVAVHLVMATTLTGCALGALAPERRAGRVLAFLGLLQAVALVNSFGKVSHAYHGWVLASFWLMFLPARAEARPAARRLGRQRYLLVVWASLAIVLLSYSMAGFWKTAVGLYQLALGEVSAFHPHALAYHVARRLLQTRSTTALGAFVVEHAWVGWPLFLLTLYLELFAFVAAFRPRLHRLWGLGLMGLHLGSYLILGVGHAPQVLLLALLGVGSPFAPSATGVRETLADLPLLGWPWRLGRPAGARADVRPLPAGPLPLRPSDSTSPQGAAGDPTRAGPPPRR